MIRLKEFFRTLHHRKWVRAIVYSFFIIGLPIIGPYAYFIEPRWVQITKTKIPLHKKNKNILRVIQISDIHFGPTNNNLQFLQKCVARINQLNPDFVLMTGDFMQWDSSFAAPLADILKDLNPKYGCFASLGNHDYGVCHPQHPPTDPVDPWQVIREFQAQNITVLHNERHQIEINSLKVDIIGLGDFWTEHFKPQSVLEKKSWEESPSTDSVTILLSHNPDSIDFLKHYHFDVMLSGHVHGGQISFPFIGPLVVPVKNRHLRRGLFKFGSQWLHTNRGMGHIFQARFLSRPEISYLEIG